MPAGNWTLSKDGDGGEEREDWGEAVHQLCGRALPPVVEGGAEGGSCKCSHVKLPGKLERGWGWEVGGKLFESKEGADELEERGQGGGRLLEAKKSEEWPLAIELRHLATVARV